MAKTWREAKGREGAAFEGSSSWLATSVALAFFLFSPWGDGRSRQSGHKREGVLVCSPGVG